MALLTVSNLPGACVEADAGVTILALLQAAGFDWMHACGAKGRCTTCRIQITAGSAHLAAPTEAELRYRTAGRLQPTERLACQARLLGGDVTGRVPRATQLPHQHYEEREQT